MRRFAEEHPFITLLCVMSIVDGIKNTVVGSVRAITGKYPVETTRRVYSTKETIPNEAVTISDDKNENDITE